MLPTKAMVEKTTGVMARITRATFQLCTKPIMNPEEAMAIP